MNKFWDIEIEADILAYFISIDSKLLNNTEWQIRVQGDRVQAI